MLAQPARWTKPLLTLTKKLRIEAFSILWESLTLQLPEAKASPTLPFGLLGDAALLDAFTDALQSRDAMRLAMAALLDGDPSPPGLVGHGSSRP
jgi:hypothetical protein